MNGEELRETLRSEMAEVDAPPPLSAATALALARRARVRRHTAWACTGAAAAVLAVAGVAAVGVPGAEGYRPAGPGPAGPVPQGIPNPSAKDTAKPWPTGPDGVPQQDRTARAGTRHDQGVRLLDAILAVVPAGYTAPENPANRPAGQMPLRDHQAQFENKINGVDVWSYLSTVTLKQGARTGRLAVEVHTAGNTLPSEPCDLARRFWGMQGECQVSTVGGRKVGVVVRPTGDDRFDQWAAYRHPDGVVVYVAQARSLGTGPGLTALPFSVEQLAAMTGDERFHLR
ncbi:hypothetical protein [Micromonospora halophytica]|uniref:Uncharacterized protein n=1 Tax=Micromonospora halophytica TaxID=47864 RepID=A0A1C5HAK4_9ACTN|nr:hypothetical protein [Micromonospora halophytica]SCG43058.1 hypothetical protein GA0070560_103388 [Micromonospora halophytica]